MNITIVSIIMPAYNSSRWISDSIQSVLDQYFEHRYYFQDDAVDV